MGDAAPHELPAPSNIPKDTNWEIKFYQNILSRSPNYVEVLMVLGNLYTGSKMYAKGLEVDQRLASLKKDDPVVQYNLACSYALLNQANEAFAALNKAAELGYRDVDHMNNDPDLDKIRSDPRYAEAVAGMCRSKEHSHPEC